MAAPLGVVNVGKMAWLLAKLTPFCSTERSASVDWRNASTAEPRSPSATKMMKFRGGRMVMTSVARLSARFWSSRSNGANTLAVLATAVPVATELSTVAVMVKVVVPPLSRSTVVLMSPVPEVANTLEPALAVAVQLTLVSSDGRASSTSAPVTSNGPWLVTITV